MNNSSNSSTGSRGSRGRRLDAPGEGFGAPAENPPAVDADLAALLDSEVKAIATGGAAPKGAIITPVTGGRSSGAALEGTNTRSRSGREQPDTAQDQASLRTAQDGTVTPNPAPASEQNRPLPATRRIGAIVLETASGPQGQQGASGTAMTALADQMAAAQAVRGMIGPGAPVDIVPMPSPRQLTAEQRAAILAAIDPAWLKSLHKEIDDLYKQITTDFASPPATAEQMLSMLHEARQTLIENPEEYVAAEYRTREVKTMIERMRESRHTAGYFGPRLLGYELGWVVLFLAGLALATPVLNSLAQLGSMGGTTASELAPFWSTMMWGGIGGVIGALYHLWWHVSDQQDFDRQYLLWYLVQPVMGMVLGGIIFLIIAGGFLVLQVDVTSDKASTAARLLPYLAAVLGGFRQNFVYEQFDRLMALFTAAGTGSASNSSKSGKGS